MAHDTPRNKHSHTLGTAAKATGRSRSTILRAIKSGKLSADKDDNGNYQIDPAELGRVYPQQPEKQAHDTPRNASEQAVATAVLRTELEAARQLADERQKTIDDLRSRLDKEGEERRQITARLLEYEQHPRGSKGLWSRIFRPE